MIKDNTLVEQWIKAYGKQIDLILSAMIHRVDEIDKLRHDIAVTLIRTFVMSKNRNKNLNQGGKAITEISETNLFQLAFIVKSAVNWQEFAKRVVKIPKVTNPWNILKKYEFKWDLKFPVPPEMSMKEWRAIRRNDKNGKITDLPKGIINPTPEPPVQTPPPQMNGYIPDSFVAAVKVWMDQADGMLKRMSTEILGLQTVNKLYTENIERLRQDVSDLLIDQGNQAFLNKRFKKHTHTDKGKAVIVEEI